jgi:hypothetical protein
MRAFCRIFAMRSAQEIGIRMSLGALRRDVL